MSVTLESLNKFIWSLASCMQGLNKFVDPLTSYTQVLNKLCWATSELHVST